MHTPPFYLWCSKLHFWVVLNLPQSFIEAFPFVWLGVLLFVGLIRKDVFWAKKCAVKIDDKHRCNTKHEMSCRHIFTNLLTMQQQYFLPSKFYIQQHNGKRSITCLKCYNQTAESAVSVVVILKLQNGGRRQESFLYYLLVSECTNNELLVVWLNKTNFIFHLLRTFRGSRRRRWDI